MAGTPSESKIKLGQYVKCKMTGFTGYAHVKQTILGQTVRWDVYPDGLTPEGKPKDGFTIDEFLLEVEGDKFIEPCPLQEQIIQLGQTVYDPVSGLTGIVNSIAEHITGCRRCFVQPQGGTRDGEVIDGLWVPETVLQLAARKKKPTAQEKETDKKLKQAANAKTGGPSNMRPVSSHQAVRRG